MRQIRGENGEKTIGCKTQTLKETRRSCKVLEKWEVKIIQIGLRLKIDRIFFEDICNYLKYVLLNYLIPTLFLFPVEYTMILQTSILQHSDCHLHKGRIILQRQLILLVGGSQNIAETLSQEFFSRIRGIKSAAKAHCYLLIQFDKGLLYVCNMYVLCIRNACSFCMCVHVCARVFVTSRYENMLNFEEQYEIIFGNCRLSKQSVLKNNTQPKIIKTFPQIHPPPLHEIINQIKQTGTCAQKLQL